MKTPIFVVAAATFSIAASANGEEFKGIQLGATEMDVARIHGGRFECKRSDDDTMGQTVCGFRSPTAHMTIGGAPITSISLGYFDKRLGRVSIAVDEAEFPQLRQAMIDKYGVPQDVSTSTLVTRAGVSLANESLTWMQPNHRITLLRYAGSIDRTLVEYISREAQAAISAALLEARKSRARDF
jgi:hypothetical protein